FVSISIDPFVSVSIDSFVVSISIDPFVSISIDPFVSISIDSFVSISIDPFVSISIDPFVSISINSSPLILYHLLYFKPMNFEVLMFNLYFRIKIFSFGDTLRIFLRSCLFSKYTKSFSFIMLQLSISMIFYNGKIIKIKSI
ncbi:hypothetical protein CWI36_1994p0010, partial [Hamiltosporidium magnivora]